MVIAIITVMMIMEDCEAPIYRTASCDSPLKSRSNSSCSQVNILTVQKGKNVEVGKVRALGGKKRFRKQR